MFETPYKLRYSIWLPFSLFIILLVVIISVYYPIQQENLFRENKKKQLTELSKTVALGVTISLDINNYTGLKKTIDFVTQSSDFEFAAIVSIDSATKKETLFTVFPENYSKYVFTRDNTKFLYAENDFKSKNMSGRIILAASQKTINNAVIEINTPIYFILAIALAIMLIVNFLIARKIAKPILELTEASKTLSKGNFELEISINDEIEELQQLGLSLDTLRKGLQEERKINVELTNSLEETVKIRTKDLSIAREKLEEASKIAQLGQFEYRFEDKTWSSSVLLDRILGINANYPKDFLSLMELIHPDDKREFMRALWKWSVGNSDYKVDFRLLKGENNIRWITARGKVEYNIYSKPVSISGVFQDITERKNYEEEINKLSMVARHTSNLVIISDEKRRIQWVNKSFYNLTGYTTEEVIGQTPKMFQFEKTNPDTVKYIREKLDAGESVIKTEILNRGKYGREYWLELNIVPIFNGNNDISGYIAVETDITEKKHLIESLKNNQDKLKQSNESLEIRVLENTRKNLDLSKSLIEQDKLATIGEISAGIAHDLNTPLGAIKVGVENISSSFEGLLQLQLSKCTEEQKEFAVRYTKNKHSELFVGGLQLIKEKKEMIEILKKNFTNADEQYEKIAELIVRCRIKPTEMEEIRYVMSCSNKEDILSLIYHLQTIYNIFNTIKNSVDNAGRVLKNIGSFIKANNSLEKQKVNIYSNIQTVLNIFNYELRKDISVKFDVDQQLHINGYGIKLFQLWSNLIKNAIEAMEGQQEKTLSITSKETEEHIIINVQNNGPEIPGMIVDKIFRKFFTTKQNRNGTGLGLSIVKNVVDEHGAKVDVTSNQDCTVFSIYFKKLSIQS